MSFLSPTPVAEDIPADGRKAVWRAAHADFVRGVLAWPLWLSLGVQDIRIRYRRTILGPLWITVGMAATFVVMGMLFSAVLKNDVRTYLPYLAVGIVVWNFVSTTLGEAPAMFVDAHHIINALRMPLVVHVLRGVVKNFIVFLHNFAAALAAFLVLGHDLSWAHGLLLLTLPLLFAAVFASSLFLAVLGARFRDLAPIVGVLTQMMFFVTPIMWRLEDLPLAKKWWVAVNPAYHLLECVRAPTLGAVPETVSVVVAVAGVAALGAMSYGLFCVCRRRIPYWL